MLIIDFETLPKKRMVRYRKYKFRMMLKNFGDLDPSKDIIKSSGKIRKLLLTQFHKLDLTPKLVLNDAKKHGMILNKAAFSRYFNNEFKEGGILTQYQILWLCVRWSIKISFKAELADYNEKECLKNIHELCKV
jgi:hypothetical protein